MARQKREIIHARFQTEENPRSNLPRKPDLDLYIGANKPLSKFDPEGVLHYTKVLPWETSPLYPKPPSFISKLNKTAGHGYIDTPGTVYLEVFVDSPQGCIVLSFSFAGGGGPKTKDLRILEMIWSLPVVNGGRAVKPVGSAYRFETSSHPSRIAYSSVGRALRW